MQYVFWVGAPALFLICMLLAFIGGFALCDWSKSKAEGSSQAMIVCAILFALCSIALLILTYLMWENT